MNEQLLKDYARLLAVMGVSCQKDEEVWINANLDQIDFVRLVCEECYKAGAKFVRVRWNDDKVNRLTYKYAKTSILTKVSNYSIAEQKYLLKNKCSMLHIISDDPDAFKGINQKKITKSMTARRKKFKPYRDLLDGKYKWCIAAVPSTAWAKKIFPNNSEEDAVEKLWNAILTASRVDGNDPVKNWEEHNKSLKEKCRKLESLDLQYLRYKASNGTDFKVELIKNAKWGGGIEFTDKNRGYNPNIPSEEAFTSPKAGSCEGIVYSTKPLSFQGEVIEDFSIKFENGKVSEVKANKNEELLKQMISMDEGAKMLGEVALIPYDSPIRNTEILFYETLFDENASCHLALGAGFRELIPGQEKMTIEELNKIGLNDSIIHVDFMIGTKDMDIVGISYDGVETQIFKDGNWAI